MGRPGEPSRPRRGRAVETGSAKPRFRAGDRPGASAAGLERAVYAIGNFDGVHRGHAAVLARTNAVAEARGAPSAVLTFEPHPADYFAGRPVVFRLTPFAVKARALQSLGLDGAVVLSFDAALAGLTAEEFVERVLVERLERRRGRRRLGLSFRQGAVGHARLPRPGGRALRISGRNRRKGRGARGRSSRGRFVLGNSPRARTRRRRGRRARPRARLRGRRRRRRGAKARARARRPHRQYRAGDDQSPRLWRLRRARARGGPDLRRRRQLRRAPDRRATARRCWRPSVRFCRRPLRAGDGGRIRRAHPRRAQIRLRSTDLKAEMARDIERARAALAARPFGDSRQII